MNNEYLIDMLNVRINSAWIVKDWDEVIRLRRALDALMMDSVGGCTCAAKTA